MSVITLDEQNRKRIQKFLKQEIGFYGYEKDIELLEQNGQLTESLARKIFTEIMNDAHRTRTMLEPDEYSEFKKEIEEAFARYDGIPKPDRLEEYGFYDGIYDNMELDDIYSNMQIAFELRELDNKYYGCRDLRNIAGTVINSIEGIDKYQPNIQEPLEEQKLKNETIIILGLIYRDFLCSSDEKKRLQEKDARELQELQELEKAIEEEMRVKFNPDDIFKKHNITNNPQTEECKSMVVVEEKWYKKIFNLIKSIFKKKY